jgi:hypothetical protein
MFSLQNCLCLAKLYVENLKEGSFVPEDEKFAKICKLYQQIPPDNVDKTAYLGKKRWTNEWMDEWMNEWMNESMNKWINE